MIASRLLFNVALGLTDGLLTALILTAGVLFHGTTGIGIGQALRVAAAAALSGLFTVFVSDYARLRGELRHAARELNLASVRPLLAGRLRSRMRAEAATAALTTTTCSFIGAMIPLGPAVIWPRPWTAPLAASLTLVIIGLALGRIVGGRSFVWAFLLLVGGAAITLTGVWLDVVG
jgi:VIT1/CCC1 family predicted Fe2+/Mn2+ transporter